MGVKLWIAGALIAGMGVIGANAAGHLQHPQLNKITDQVLALAQEGLEKAGPAEQWIGKGIRQVSAWLPKPPPGQNPDLTGSICGTAAAVLDGDTFTLRTSTRPALRVRLAQIDAPEKSQPYGVTSGEALASLVEARETCIKPAGADGQYETSYGRYIAWVWRPGDAKSVNHQLVEGGHAHVVERFLTDKSLAGLQQDAQRAQRGLWALPESERISPYAWRQNAAK
ncbi:thermonuclease family protein [Geopseudomonas aromaticivorans]